MADSDEISIAVDEEMAAELQKLVDSVNTASSVSPGLSTASAPTTAVVSMNKEAAARLFSKLAEGILEAAAITSRSTGPKP